MSNSSDGGLKSGAWLRLLAGANAYTSSRPQDAITAQLPIWTDVKVQEKQANTDQAEEEGSKKSSEEDDNHLPDRTNRIQFGEDRVHEFTSDLSPSDLISRPSPAMQYSPPKSILKKNGSKNSNPASFTLDPIPPYRGKKNLDPASFTLDPIPPYRGPRAKACTKPISAVQDPVDRPQEPVQVPIAALPLEEPMQPVAPTSSSAVDAPTDAMDVPQEQVDRPQEPVQVPIAALPLETTPSAQASALFDQAPGATISSQQPLPLGPVLVARLPAAKARSRYERKPSQIISCSVCYQKFTAPHYLKKHMASHKGGPCKICGIIVSANENFEAHVAKYHPEMAEGGAKKRHSLQCQSCYKEFPSLAALDVHKKKKHKRVQENKCEKCGKNLLSKAKLDKHMISAHTERIKVYTCEHCNLKFPSPTVAALNSHIRKVHGIFPNKCSGCDSTFETMKQLKEHMKNCE